MTPDKKMFYYSLTLKTNPLGVPVGASCHLQPETIYFSTTAKLERWRTKNPDKAKDAVWAMDEISLKCAKELIKLSKKKVKHRCYECGR